MKPNDNRVSEALSGLKPQVQSAPFSLEMVSVLFFDVEPEPEPEPELEPAPALQPAASNPAAATRPAYLMRRLMPFVLTAVVVLTTRGLGPRRPVRAGRSPRLRATRERLLVAMFVDVAVL